MKKNNGLKSNKIPASIFYAALEATANGVVITNKKGDIEWVNKAFTRLTGYDFSEVVGKNPRILKSGKQGPDVYKKLWKTVMAGKIWQGEIINKRKDGTLYTEEMTISPVVASGKKVSHFVAIKQDISERKKIEFLENQKKLLLQEKLKSDFIADATHELRTPLAIIRGNIDLITREESVKKSTKKLKEINNEIEHLTGLISDLTLLTSDNTGFHRKINLEEIQLIRFLKTVMQRSRTLALKKNISIRIKNITDVKIMGDRVYLEKLFFNVIRNGITYGKERGFVHIDVLKNKNFVKINISDNGMGVGKQELPFIFDRFYRTNEARATKHKGTGLGLSISKWIVEAHGGKINVMSTKGKGSTFSIFLPLSNK